MTSPEWLLAVPTIAAAVADSVNDLRELGSHDAPGWVMRLGVPPRWRLAQLVDVPLGPARITVCGSSTGFQGCETLSAFRFAGVLQPERVTANADCTLRGLHAENITTTALATPPVPGVVAVRASGYFAAGWHRIWAQHSIYAMDATSPAGQCLLVEHNLFVDADHEAELSADITTLTNSAHYAFLATLTRGR